MQRYQVVGTQSSETYRSSAASAYAATPSPELPISALLGLGLTTRPARSLFGDMGAAIPP
jgi:hypothetical protein